MRARTGEESVESRGTTARNDWFYPVDGGSSGDGGITEEQVVSVGFGAGSSQGDAALQETPGGDALNECKDGVCPVPWATNAVSPGKPVTQPDVVHHPSHYVDNGGIECIEAIEAQLSDQEYRGYLHGNCVKYLWRWKNKGGVTDLKKCSWYLDRLITLAEIQNG